MTDKYWRKSTVQNRTETWEVQFKLQKKKQTFFVLGQFKAHRAGSKQCKL